MAEEVIDRWLYANESTYTRVEKSQNFWKSNQLLQFNDSLLLAWRLVTCAVWLYLEVPL